MTPRPLGVMTRSPSIRASATPAEWIFRGFAAVTALPLFYVLTAPIGLKLTEHMSTWPAFYQPVLWIWRQELLRSVCEWYFNEVWHVGFWPNW
jgi:hypothetical protein